MKKVIIGLSIIIVAIAGCILKESFSHQIPSKKYKIGILQAASHPALDAARDGFIEELKNSLGDSVEYSIKNAQGLITQSHAIAQQLCAHKDFNCFFAIATPAAQALASIEKSRPIIIAAVTDPSAIGLTHSTSNVCGVQDMINTSEATDLIIKLVPSAKTIGLIYSSGEINSTSLIHRMHQELTKNGLTFLDFAISNESDLPIIIDQACRKADLIFAPTDNTIASAISMIAAIALKNKKPLIVSDAMLVPSGALAARGIDYKASGKQAARAAYEILVNGKQPQDLSIQQSQSITTIINETRLNALELPLPESLKNSCTLIKEKND